MLQELLESHVMDPKNAYKCYDLATEYDRLEQGAMGVSLYLKAADLSNDKLLQYKSMIGLALIYYRQGRRDFTVEGGLLDAVALCPERPEAHYHLCAYYEHKANWKHCLAHANTALAFSVNSTSALANSAASRALRIGAGMSALLMLSPSYSTNSSGAFFSIASALMM